jgi:hypothetical protein
MSYTITFDRVGRNHNVPNLVTGTADAQVIAEEVYRIARRNCGSRDLEVTVDMEAMKGHIYAGFHNAGSFTIAEDTP